MQPPPDLPDMSELQSQLKQLEELLSMPPEKLRRLRQSIEFIERMSTVERESMHIRLSQITQATPELLEEINTFNRFLPQHLHSTFSQFWYASSEEERGSVRSRLSELETRDKIEFLTPKVEAFARHRDEVFAKMRESLENKRKSQGPKSSVPSP
jgi:hypothetical protein